MLSIISLLRPLRAGTRSVTLSGVAPEGWWRANALRTYLRTQRRITAYA